jgi:hypothetical protein
MSVLIYPHQFDASHLHFGTAISNNDIANSKFARIVYSTKNISFNGVGVVINLAGSKHEHHYNKIFMWFDPALPVNQIIASQLHAIECKIINNYVDAVIGSPRRCVHLLTNQFNIGCIKTYINDSGLARGTPNDNAMTNANGNQIMLKICGVWETNDECGITYKYIKC